MNTITEIEDSKLDLNHLIIVNKNQKTRNIPAIKLVLQERVEEIIRSFGTEFRLGFHFINRCR